MLERNLTTYIHRNGFNILDRTLLFKKQTNTEISLFEITKLTKNIVNMKIRKSFFINYTSRISN